MQLYFVSFRMFWRWLCLCLYAPPPLPAPATTSTEKNPNLMDSEIQCAVVTQHRLSTVTEDFLHNTD